MNFDPNSEQENLPESAENTPAPREEMELPPMQTPAGEQESAQLAPMGAISAVPEEALPPMESLSADAGDAPPDYDPDAQPQEIEGAYSDPSETEETAPSTYRGRFAAREPVPEEPAPDTEVSEAAQGSYSSAQEQEPSAAYDDGGGIVPPIEPQQYNAAPEEPAPAPQPRNRTRAVKKGRPRRRKGEGMLGIPNIVVTCVWACLVLLTSVTLGRLAWVCASEVLAFGREDKTVTITVYENDTIDDITQKLQANELIQYPGLFKLYAKFAVDDGDIKPGIWDLNTKYDYHALVKMMSPSSTRDVVKVMIPEGYSCRQIFALLEENKVCTVQDIESYAASGELNDYWFLDGVARGDRYCLEGFLFPDTYEFYQNDSPRSVLNKMLSNFDTRFDEDMRGRIQTLNTHLADLMRRDGKAQDYIDSHLFTVRDVVNVASMIEKETSSAEEGYTIASVIYNRLFYWHGNPAYLNIDATIIYALNGKTDLTAEDLRVDSPYNTYTNVGLTPGPIANPGLNSLRAALEPAETNYYYYVLDPTAGSHVFSTTQEEHEANRARLGV